MTWRNDLTGQQFGNLTVLEQTKKQLHCLALPMRLRQRDKS